MIYVNIILLISLRGFLEFFLKFGSFYSMGLRFFFFLNKGEYNFVFYELFGWFIFNYI